MNSPDDSNPSTGFLSPRTEFISTKCRSIKLITFYHRDITHKLFLSFYSPRWFFISLRFIWCWYIAEAAIKFILSHFFVCITPHAAHFSFLFLFSCLAFFSNALYASIGEAFHGNWKDIFMIYISQIVFHHWGRSNQCKRISLLTLIKLQRWRNLSFCVHRWR